MAVDNAAQAKRKASSPTRSSNLTKLAKTRTLSRYFLRFGGWWVTSGALQHEDTRKGVCPVSGLQWKVKMNPSWDYPHLCEHVVQLCLQGEPDFDPALNQREYHSTNVLWHQGLVSRVEDGLTPVWDRRTQHSPLPILVGDGEELPQCVRNAAQRFAYRRHRDGVQVPELCLPEPVSCLLWETFALARIPQEVLHQRPGDYVVRMMSKTLELGL